MKRAAKKTKRAVKSTATAEPLGTCTISGGNVSGTIVIKNVKEKGCKATATLAKARYKFVPNK